MRSELDNLPQPNWFWHGEQILNLIEQFKPMNCVELGTNLGCSAIATARLIKTWGGILSCVDQWVPNGGNLCSLDVFYENAKNAGVLESVRPLRARTWQAAVEWSYGPIDYLYVDADHTFDAVTSDLEAWWPHLRVGGLIAGDDYEDPYDDEFPQNVTRAWDSFELNRNQAFERTVSPDLLGAKGRPASRLIWGVKR